MFLFSLFLAFSVNAVPFSPPLEGAWKLSRWLCLKQGQQVAGKKSLAGLNLSQTQDFFVFSSDSRGQSRRRRYQKKSTTDYCQILRAFNYIYTPESQSLKLNFSKPELEMVGTQAPEYCKKVIDLKMNKTTSRTYKVVSGDAKQLLLEIQSSQMAEWTCGKAARLGLLLKPDKAQ